MRKYFGAAAAVIFVLCFLMAIFGGRRSAFESPMSSLPSIVVDHFQNETEIYVHGLTEFRFTNMTIWLSDGETEILRHRENTYFIFLNTSLTHFSLNVSVWSKNKMYGFRADVRVADPDEAPTLLLLHEERGDSVTTHALQKGNLPWKRIMERVV